MRWSFARLVSVGLVISGIALLVFQLRSGQLLKPLAQTKLQESVSLLTPAAVPVLSETALPDQFIASLSAEVVYAMDVQSASILLSRQPNKAIYPASTTKLMTVLVAMETYAPERVLQVTPEALVPGTALGLQPGEQLTVRDLLSAVLMVSANDAATVLATSYPGGIPQFTARMNQLAMELQLHHTTFSNPSGLDDDDQQTTARELALLAREVMARPVLASIVSQPQARITEAIGLRQYVLTSTNRLLTEDSSFVGVKTGTTERAGEVLVSQYQSPDHTVLIVVAGSDDRYRDTRLIKNWIESHYTWVVPTSATLE